MIRPESETDLQRELKWLQARRSVLEPTAFLSAAKTAELLRVTQDIRRVERNLRRTENR